MLLFLPLGTELCHVKAPKEIVKGIPVHILPNPFFLNYDSPIETITSLLNSYFITDKRNRKFCNSELFCSGIVLRMQNTKKANLNC